MVLLGKKKFEEINAFLAGCFVEAFANFVPFFAFGAFVRGFAFCSWDTRFAERSLGAAAATAAAAAAAAEVEVQVLRAAGLRWEEMSKSSLNLDMQRDDSIFHAPALANAAPVVQRVAKTRVLRVVQWNKLCLAVAAIAQALHVKACARLVKVKLRPLATVRARDNVKLARLEKTVAKRAVAKTRRFQAEFSSESATREKISSGLCGHEKFRNTLTVSFFSTKKKQNRHAGT